jgi:hypothetical protein
MRGDIILILIALIGAGGAVLGPYVVARLNRQDKTLGSIQVNVNGRLDRLLQERAEHIEKIATLEAEKEIQEKEGTT